MEMGRKLQSEFINKISAQYVCFLNVTQVGKVLGIGRETARNNNCTEIQKSFGICKDITGKICSNLEPEKFGRVKRYFIIDVLEFMYNQK